MIKVVNIAAYHFHPQPLDQLQSRRDALRALCRGLDLKGTILLSGEGINMFIAGSRDAVNEVVASVQKIPGMADLPIKESITDYQPFHRMLVKIKQEIIPVGCADVRPAPGASPKLSPAELKSWLDGHRDVTLLDTRNDYEVALGTFHGAIDLKLKNFREFPAAAAALPDEIKKKPVVMFCTGGIRCEKIGPYMKGLGFDQIYQLEGGILKYFEDCNQSHYDGECFVFDQRVAVDPSLMPTDALECFACKHVLTPEDCRSPQYQEGVSCPHCFVAPETRASHARAERQTIIDRIASEQRGCIPYTNRRWISIPRRCAGLPLVEALLVFYPGYSRLQWLAAIEQGEITSPASTKSQWKTEFVTPDRVVREGERFLHAVPNTIEPAINPLIELLYEDEALVVINKDAPLPLHPSGRYHKNTLESILHAAYDPEKLRPAHRIDAMTTGLVVFTRKYQYASRLQPQFASGAVEKTYLAWVEEKPTWEQTTCELAIANEPLANSGRSLDPNGQPAITLFRVRERQNGQSLIEAIPKTGRTHQIRLHLAALGHPIVGDPLYIVGGTSRDAIDDNVSQPMLLHSWKIAFDHPITGQRVTFETPPPSPSLEGWVERSERRV